MKKLYIYIDYAYILYTVQLIFFDVRRFAAFFRFRTLFVFFYFVPRLFLSRDKYAVKYGRKDVYCRRNVEHLRPLFSSRLSVGERSDHGGTQEAGNGCYRIG